MFTIGHSTLQIETFIAALKENGVRRLIDVRTIPRSRHNPQFGTDALSASLKSASLEYRWLSELGGLRHTTKSSINRGWRNASFRGYADYMQTPEFARAMDELVALGKETTSAIMCSEAVPWRCHRSLVGDALLVRGCPVEDIFVAASGQTHRRPHALTRFARVDGLRLWYPDDPERPELPLGAQEPERRTARKVKGNEES